MEADVIVIGTGAAGMFAAMAAADTGAKVLNLEKMPKPGGVIGYRGGTIIGAQTKIQFRNGVFDDSPALFYTDMMRWETSREYSDAAVLRYYCDHSGEAVDWFDARGAFQPPLDKPMPGMYGDPWSVLRTCGIRGPLLAYVMPDYQKRIDREDVTLLTGITVTGLLQEDGRVVGVRVKADGDNVTEYRTGAVVVCTGGFGSNTELVKRNLPGARFIVSHTPAYARGEGLLMCQEIGAELVNMDHTMSTGPYGGALPAPDNPSRPIAHVNLMKYPGAIWVSTDGKRVVNEDCGGYSPMAREAVKAAPGNIINVVIDSKIKAENTSILSGIFTTPPRDWDWFDEKAAEGVIVKMANTIEELAVKLEVPVEALRDTVAEWNAAVAAGKDQEFGRTELGYRLENPPYYGIITGTMLIASMGGPAVNVRQQVLSEGSRVIPGLYAAGEVAGYQGQGSGSLHTGCVVFGWQAGACAAREALARRSQIQFRSS